MQEAERDVALSGSSLGLKERSSRGGETANTSPFNKTQREPFQAKGFGQGPGHKSKTIPRCPHAPPLSLSLASCTCFTGVCFGNALGQPYINSL